MKLPKIYLFKKNKYYKKNSMIKKKNQKISYFVCSNVAKIENLLVSIEKKKPRQFRIKYKIHCLFVFCLYL